MTAQDRLIQKWISELQDQSGNISKPLLCEVFTDEVKVIPINKITEITEKEKKDYTKLVLTQTKSF